MHGGYCRLSNGFWVVSKHNLTYILIPKIPFGQLIVRVELLIAVLNATIPVHVVLLDIQQSVHLRIINLPKLALVLDVAVLVNGPQVFEGLVVACVDGLVQLGFYFEVLGAETSVIGMVPLVHRRSTASLAHRLQEVVSCEGAAILSERVELI